MSLIFVCFQDFLTLPPVLFAPVVEPPLHGAFLLDTPDNLYAKGLVAKIPWIVSLTTEESDATIECKNVKSRNVLD